MVILCHLRSYTMTDVCYVWNCFHIAFYPNFVPHLVQNLWLLVNSGVNDDVEADDVKLTAMVCAAKAKARPSK